jgi:hypothetical protein
MIESAVADDDKVACLWFNGWAFQGFDDAKNRSHRSHHHAVDGKEDGYSQGQGTSKEAPETLELDEDHARGNDSQRGGAAWSAPSSGSRWCRVRRGNSQAKPNLSQAMKSATSLRVPPAFSSQRKKTSCQTHSHDFREEFAKLLEESKIDQLVVLIDDLDRCLPETAIATPRSDPSSFLFVPHSAFVIGADETMIEYAVRQHFTLACRCRPALSRMSELSRKADSGSIQSPGAWHEESKMYVTLLLAQALWAKHTCGSWDLLAEARLKLRQPWLRTTLSLGDIVALDPKREDQLKATFVLAQQDRSDTG